MEARALVAAGHRELVVTGINVGTYSYRNYNFVDVITALEDIAGLDRIRISSIEPTTIPLAVFTRMTKESKLCRHLHIPLQSGSNTILSAMKRKYTREEFSDFISSVTDMVDGLCVGTDIIVGFPGEEEADFQQTAELVRDLPIHYFHVFSYSERQYARSRHSKAPVPAAEIRRRSQVLRDLSRRKRAAFHQSLLGSTQSVLFEQQREGYFCGLTDNYVRVHTATNRNITNHLCKIQLNGLDADKLYGIIEEI